MDPSSREDLSALMDGELAAEPTRFLLRRLEHDPELGAAWSRWHLIRACLASDASRMSALQRDDDFVARVSGVLAADVGRRSHERHWVRYVGGSAIAAGVAVVALMLNMPNSPERAMAPQIQAHSAPGVATLAEAAPTAPPAVPAWLLSRQPTVLGAQPASADVVYGTGLMEPGYLRRATYARNAAFPYAASTGSDQSGLPFSIVVMPAPPPSSAAAVVGH
ncbi:MAG: sigma-E factor negative regulatory protein [Rhodanobacteraceae bacterium]